MRKFSSPSLPRPPPPTTTTLDFRGGFDRLLATTAVMRSVDNQLVALSAAVAALNFWLFNIELQKLWNLPLSSSNLPIEKSGIGGEIRGRAGGTIWMSSLWSRPAKRTVICLKAMILY